MAETGAQVDYSLLPKDKSFSKALPAFLLPYFAYVALGSLPPSLLTPEVSGWLRLVAVSALLWFFRKSYRFGPSLTPRQFGIGLAASVAAFALWVATYRVSLSLPWWRVHLASAEPASLSPAYWMLRTVNSVLLVPVFEELLCRAYLCELFFLGKPPDAGGSQQSMGQRLGRRLDANPQALSAPPLSAFSVIGSTALFSLGHDTSAWIPAVVYFGFTTWLYARTRSFRLCILVHALTNLGIALAVAGNAGLRFLWF